MTEAMGPTFYPDDKCEFVGGPLDGGAMLMSSTSRPSDEPREPVRWHYVMTGRKTKAGHWEVVFMREEVL